MSTMLRAVLAGAVALAVAGCGGEVSPSASHNPPHTGAAAASPAVPTGVDESLRRAAVELVAERQRALVEGDRAALLATVDPDETDFAATQARWFDNLADLPVTQVSLAVADVRGLTSVHGEGALQLSIDFTMRLEGFDPEPVTQRQTYTFNRTASGVALANDRNPQMDAQHGWLPAPWDITRTGVRRDGPVLGIFDAGTVSYADSVMAELAGARDRVRAFDPSWPGRVVAYVISDTRALDTMSEMAVHDTGGVAFPVLAAPDSERVATYRFMINPEVAASPSASAYLASHELVHVALAARDDDSPAWLVEGIAEHVASAQLTTRARRQYVDETLSGVPPRRLSLEPGVSFYRQHPDEQYALASVVCAHLESTRGPDVLLELVDAYDRAGAASTVESETVLRRRLGIGSAELVREALDWAGISV